MFNKLQLYKSSLRYSLLFIMRVLLVNVEFKLLQILPMALQNCLDEEVQTAVVKVSCVNQRLGEQEITLADKESDMENVAEAMYLLKKVFPPTFIDVMLRLMIHLVEELYVYGPIHCRWMYPVERYMKTLKDYVRIYARPEASMAIGYIMSETLGFCTEYMQSFKGTTRRVWDEKEEKFMNDEVRQGSGWVRPMSEEFRLWIHNFVINNLEVFKYWHL